YFACRFGKLHPRADGLFRAHKRINDNAYKIDLPGEYHVSATFNVADLSPYFTDEEDSNVEETNVRQDSRSNLLLAGGMMAWALNGKISIPKPDKIKDKLRDKVEDQVQEFIDVPNTDSKK
ncbi:hypothetical protein Tco_0492837, partial [Tanacetum coccineum]